MYCNTVGGLQGAGGGGVGGGGVQGWVAAVVVAAAVVEGEALVVTSTPGMVVVMTSLPRTQRMQSQSILVAKLVLLPSTYLCACVRCRYWFNIIVLEYLWYIAHKHTSRNKLQ